VVLEFPEPLPYHSKQWSNYGVLASNFPLEVRLVEEGDLR